MGKTEYSRERRKVRSVPNMSQGESDGSESANVDQVKREHLSVRRSIRLIKKESFCSGVSKPVRGISDQN